MEKYIRATETINNNDNNIIEQAVNITKTCHDNISKAIKLYYFVRDEVTYNPYIHFHESKYYRASRILKVKQGNCICKAVLLCAFSRAVKIPARLGFANVRNHLASEKLIKFIGSKIFIFHGYMEFFLNNKWVIATPAFNHDLCLRHNVSPLDFDGFNDSIFQLYNSTNKIYMEYLKYHGTFHDLPLTKILSAWKKEYGKERVMGWIRDIEKNININDSFY